MSGPELLEAITEFGTDCFMVGQVCKAGSLVLRNACSQFERLSEAGEAIAEEQKAIPIEQASREVQDLARKCPREVLTPEQIQQAERLAQGQETGGSMQKQKIDVISETKVGGNSFLEINHPVLDSERVGSALKSDAFHAFSDIIDNYAKYAKKFELIDRENIVKYLYQIEGALNKESGIFEWIVHPQKGVIHRLFIRGGKITGRPNTHP